MIFYDAGIAALERAIRFSGHWAVKNRMWAEGREGIIEKIRRAISPDERIFWLHAASVGEFEQGRPIVEYVRAHHPEYKILVTFYSPSGYNLRKDWKGADHVFYFPSDRKKTVREFLDAVHPEIAVFVKYEFWLNTLEQLRQRGIRTFLICAVFRRNSIFFLPWGREWRKALRTFETIFVQDMQSVRLLDKIGVENVTLAGDTRFDRVLRITQTDAKDEIVEEFLHSSHAFVAGSTWGPDETILIRLANDNPDIKFIIAPHEMDESRIARIVRGCKLGATRYTAPCPDLSEKQILIVDTVGLLAMLYRYARWAYVGGGFGAGIHNTVEPAAYGIPIAFGPKYGRFNEAVAMVQLGTAQSVHNYKELSDWFSALGTEGEAYREICLKSREYTRSQLGATEKIIKTAGL